jgi:hypothetical protein
MIPPTKSPVVIMMMMSLSNMKTKEQIVEEIQQLELEIGLLLEQQGGSRYGHQFPKILKLTRKVQKLRNKL